MNIKLKVNGIEKNWDVAPGESALEVIRREGFTGAKKGCDTGECGACTILLNGRPVLACILFAAKLDGQEITTIEGLGSISFPHPIQRALVEAGAVQCGFCIPGIVLSMYALLQERENPSREEIKEALGGHLCRCTGYVKQISAIENLVKIDKDK